MSNPREFRLPVGNAELAVFEWPGKGDPILLLHATGFHSRCWNEVVKLLPGRHIYAADLRFHGGSDATGSVNWHVMTEDIRQLIHRMDLTRLVGVGHSIGGYLIARAAAHAPQRFKHLVLIDPVIMSEQRYAQFHKMPDGAASAHPVSRRKNQWHDAQEMYERFQGRAPFNTWHPAVLHDYCDHALLPPDENGLRKLACDPLHEAGIYLNQQGNEIIHEELPRIATPVTLLRAPPGDSGLHDLSGSPTWPGLAGALRNCREVYLPQMNHFIPMQDPALVARQILSAS
jgi:pimeloyl-ACP methyl ester carboxylesterase